jgi:hypothetical protein
VAPFSLCHHLSNLLRGIEHLKRLAGANFSSKQGKLSKTIIYLMNDGSIFKLVACLLVAWVLLIVATKTIFN